MEFDFWLYQSGKTLVILLHLRLSVFPSESQVNTYVSWSHEITGDKADKEPPLRASTTAASQWMSILSPQYNGGNFSHSQIHLDASPWIKEMEGGDRVLDLIMFWIFLAEAAQDS